MTLPPNRRSDVFSDWLEARVAGASPLDQHRAADPELDRLCAAANRFHQMSEVWAEDAIVPLPPVPSWEGLMTERSVSSPSPLPFPYHRNWAGKRPGRWEAVNRCVSAALIVALVLAIGAGAWRIADRDTNDGGTGPSTGETASLVPAGDDSLVATPDENQEPLHATTPVELLPGIQSAVVRDYGWSDQPSSIPDLAAVSYTHLTLPTTERV